MIFSALRRLAGSSATTHPLAGSKSPQRVWRSATARLPEPEQQQEYRSTHHTQEHIQQGIFKTDLGSRQTKTICNPFCKFPENGGRTYASKSEQEFRENTEFTQCGRCFRNKKAPSKEEGNCAAAKKMHRDIDPWNNPTCSKKVRDHLVE